MNESIEVKISNKIATIMLNRPEVYNAFDLDMFASLANILRNFALDDNVKCIIITGKGKAFSAGGDLKWVLNSSNGYPVSFHKLAANFHQGVIEIRRMGKPVIAAINGIAAGAGFTLALACDFRIMAQSAMFKLAYNSVGLCIDGGGTFILPRLIGMARTLEIATFDAPILSKQAFEWGLVTKIVEDAKTLDEAENMARDILSKYSINSFRWTKQLLNESFTTSLETQLEHEREGICTCSSHNEGIEGLQAFKEKRKPNFRR